jgi:urocanate hydratase
MSLVSLHNGGGVGIGKVINGGYGMVLDGSERVDEILKTAMLFDVMCGVSRRAWARNENSITTASEYNTIDNNSQITIPYLTDEDYIEKLVNQEYIKGGK